MSVCECVYVSPPTSQQACVCLSPGVSVLAGQDPQGLLVRLPGLSSDPEQLPVDLTLCHPGAVTVIHLQLEELDTHTQVHTGTHTHRHRL